MKFDKNKSNAELLRDANVPDGVYLCATDIRKVKFDEIDIGGEMDYSNYMIIGKHKILGVIERDSAVSAGELLGHKETYFYKMLTKDGELHPFRHQFIELVENFGLKSPVGNPDALEDEVDQLEDGTVRFFVVQMENNEYNGKIYINSTITRKVPRELQQFCVDALRECYDGERAVLEYAETSVSTPRNNDTKTREVTSDERQVPGDDEIPF